MDERAAIPPGLPRTNPTKSYWQDPPDEKLADFKSGEELPEYADYVIVGSGISGACIAWNLLQQLKGANKTILMLEARQTCSGASGRNGGHTKAASYRFFLPHSSSHGVDEAVKIARFEYNNIIATHKVASEHGLDCESRLCQTVDIVYDSEGWPVAKEAIGAMRKAMGPNDPAAKYEILDGVKDKETIGRRCLTPAEDTEIAGAVVYQAGSVNAYKFTIELLKKCVNAGLNLQTHTPVITIEQGPLSLDRSRDIRWALTTARGKTLTTNLILATNAYTAQLLPSMQGKIVPLRGQVTAQARGPRLAELAPEGLEHTYSFAYPTGYEYMISRPFVPSVPSQHRGDIIIGGGLGVLPYEGITEYGNTDDTILNPLASAYLKETLPLRYFGSNWGADDASKRVKAEWTGIMGITGDGLPYVGEAPGKPGLWVSAGFNGHGMVRCLKCAEALAGMMLGDETITEWFPQSFRVTRERLEKVKFEGRKGMRIRRVEDGDAEKLEPHVVNEQGRQ